MSNYETVNKQYIFAVKTNDCMEQVCYEEYGQSTTASSGDRFSVTGMVLKTVESTEG
jgi:hypothetical protein